LNSHYRSPLDFSDPALFAAQSGYDRITDAVKAVRKRIKNAPEGEADEATIEELVHFRQKFEDAMNDDLNTSVALSVIFEVVRLSNKLLEGSGVTVATLNLVDVAFSRLGGEALGVVLDEYPETGVADDTRVDNVVQLLIDQRSQARKNKNFARADELRDQLGEAGVLLEDTPDGTMWRWK